ncbi:protein FAM162A-like [Prinia subflava]|uniref:protein FAM162A-like n=1 Tax=Prinia subflava TaxID=208062 RepID=UPI002FDF2E3F
MGSCPSWWDNGGPQQDAGEAAGAQPWAWPVLRSARAAGSKAKNAQDMALQMADAGEKVFRNERRPTNFDKKVLIWSGCLKKEDISRHIPKSEVRYTARNILSIKVCYIMIALTVLGCVTMISTGREMSTASGGTGSLNAGKKGQMLLRVKAEKKAKWGAEVEKGQETAVGKSQ